MIIQSVTGSITEHLRDLIMTGELKAGAKLSEVEVSTQLGVSRPPLREAFRKLENEYLIVAKPRRGVFVAEISVADCEHVYEARKMLECEAVSILKSKNIRVIPGIEEALKVSENYILSEDDDSKAILSFFNVMSAFHKRIIEATQNEWIVRFYECLSSSLTRYQVLYLHIAGSKEVSLADHRAIYHKIKRGLYEEARMDMINHINRTRFLLEEELTKVSSEEACIA